MSAEPGRWPGDPPIRGRADVLQSVAALIRGRTERVAVLHGDGGYGKSTAALAIAAEAQRAGATVLWVSAHDRDRLEAGMRAAAGRLLPSEEALDDDWNVAAPADSAWQVLDSAEQDWLLVLDNVDDPAVLEPEEDRQDGSWLRIPSGPHGFVVVTTRVDDPGRWGPYQTFPVLALSDEDGAQMLIDRTGGYTEQLGGREHARALSARLEGFPLVLSVAAAHLRLAAEHRGDLRASGETVTFDAYRARLDDRLGAEAAACDGLTREARLVRATSELALDLLEATGRATGRRSCARPVLRLMAAMAAHPIPLDGFPAPEGEESVTGGAGTADIVDTAATLVWLGLLERSTGSAERTRLREDGAPGEPAADRSVVLHDLVRDASRASADFRTSMTAYAAALESVTGQAVDGLQAEDASTWPRWRAWAPHVAQTLHFCLHEAEVAVEHPMLGRALEAAHRAAWYAHRVGLHHRSVEQLREVVSTCGVRYGPAAVETVQAKTDLARVLRDLEEWDDALALFREVLEVHEASTGERAEIAAMTTRNRIAGVLRLSSRHSEAIDEFRRVIALLKAELNGRQDGDLFLLLLSVQHNLALALRPSSQEAETLFKEVLRHRVRLLGQDHEETLQTRNQLAVVLRDRGHLTPARDQFRAVEEGRRGLLHPDERDTHRDVLSTRNQLAGTLYRMGDHQGAVDIWTDVLARRRRVLGPNHYLTHVVMQHLGRNELDAARRDPANRAEHLAAAERRLTDLRDRLKRKYGDRTNDQVLGTGTLLARVSYERGDVDAATEQFSEVLAQQEVLLGPENLWTVETVYRRGLAHLAAGRLDEAEADLRRAYHVRTAKLAPGATDVAEARAALDQVRRRRLDG
ncbi:tetratricopeptide repeat protein [Geodermatophilus sp. SYSU D00742]